MVNLHTILADHRSRARSNDISHQGERENVVRATSSEIPDVFFDQILIRHKLKRIEIMVLMYLYRAVWCQPNLYQMYGISQLLSHTEMAKNLGVSIDDVYPSLVRLEEYGFISTVRSGQYFVRKYFTKDNDEIFNQSYDDFDI
jgi:DNA-binding MarR family transcriptional regulator